MNKKILILIGLLLILLIGLVIQKYPKQEEINSLTATVLKKEQDKVTVIENNTIMTLNMNGDALKNNEDIVINYTGILDRTKQVQEIEVISYKTVANTNDLKEKLFQDGMFEDYYELAFNKLQTMSLEEKIGQILLVRYPDNNQIEVLKNIKPAGFVFFEKDFKNKTKQEVINMINNLQNNANIPLLTAVDEEGGKVVRVSSNPNLRTTPFKSPQALYKEGGFPLIKEDTIEKSNLLTELGLNLNLAPVVDVSTNPNDYIYERTIGQNTEITSEYAKTVIEASKNSKVSYTLKHFPGYSNNDDTHNNSSVNLKSYEEIMQEDIPPFKTGIENGAEAVLVSHNISAAIDNNNPATLSPTTHNILRNELDFTGVIITDDIDMVALNNIENKTIQALMSGNELIITTDYDKSKNEILQEIQNDLLAEEFIDQKAFKILAWKYYKGLMNENQK